MALKTGPLTRDDLAAVWRGALDKAYAEPFQVAGDGYGLEVHSQGWEQLARASRAIDVTTQAMFISPWSGQTDLPASGEQKAIVTLTFSRSKLTQVPLIMKAGQIFAEEVQVDSTDDGGVEVLTGRRYVLTTDLIFYPGDSGPFTVVAEAELPGYGYNNPVPGSIRQVPQPGSGFNNTGASMLTVIAVPSPTAVPPIVKLTTLNLADTFVPEHVGQYAAVDLHPLSGNYTAYGRVTTFTAPDVDADIGSAVTFALTQAFEATTYSGTFLPGETIRINNPAVIAYGTVLGENIKGPLKRVVFDLVSSFGSYAATITVTGLSSGATATVANFTYLPQLFDTENGTASWRVLDWVEDWGLTVTNDLSPAGGFTGMLDELGNERNIHRNSMEDDESYRERIRAIADVVTPNAIKRMLNKTLVAVPWCFREVGLEELPGFYFDEDAWDYDVIQLAGQTPTGTTASLGGGTLLTTFATLVGNPKWIRIGNEVIAIVQQTSPTTYIVARGQKGTVNVGHGLFAAIFQVFEENEPVQLVDTTGTIIKATGRYGSLSTGGTFIMVRKTGDYTFAAGDHVFGLFSRARYNATSAPSVSAQVEANRFRIYFDYLQFRAFFLIGVPAPSGTDSGFAYDATLQGANAWDIGFLDGSQDDSASAALYRSVYNNIDGIRAGGTVFDLYVESIGCP